MNIVIIGSGNGSMAMRGHQLGRAVGARVVGGPTPDDLAWADVVVLIKRAGGEHARVVQGANKPIVWDALDFWIQPQENVLDAATAKKYFSDQIKAIRPSLVIGATEAMAQACGGVYLPHHPWLDLTATAASPVVTTVGYQGTKKFLGQWGRAVITECERRGWHFALNPSDLRTCDLLVALRDGQHDGWMCQEWKSGVKLGNAMTAGRPVITQATAAWREMRPVGCTVETVPDLARAFDRWTSLEARQAAVTQSTAQYSLAAVATRYRSILERVASRAA